MVEDYSKLTEEERTFVVEIDKIDRRFIYDADLMSVEQISDANTKFGIYENMVKLLPATLNEFQESIKRDVLNRGFSALLIEVNKENEPLSPIYNRQEHSGLLATKHLKGLEQYQRLEACKANFFMKQGRISIESIKELTGIMQELKVAGVGTEQQMEILKMSKDNNSEFLEILKKISLPETTSKENTKENQAQE